MDVKCGKKTPGLLKAIQEAHTNKQTVLNIVHCDVQWHRRLKSVYCKFYNVCVEQRFGYTQVALPCVSHLFHTAAVLPVFMVALWNRADHYIFMLWFVLSFFYGRPME